MFRMLLIVILAALLWSGAWFWGGLNNKTRIKTWISDQQKAGYDIGFSGLSQLGFPNRYDVTLQNPQLSAGTLDLDWRAEFIQIMRLSYQPNHHILIWPNTQSVTLNQADVDFVHRGFRASVVTRDQGNLRFSAEAFDITVLAASRPWLTAQDMQFSIAENQKGAQVYLQLTGLKLVDGSLVENIRLLFDISGPTMGFDGLLPRLGPNANYEVSNIKLSIGDVEMDLDGWLAVAFDTGLRGSLSVAHLHWPELRSLLRSALAVDLPDRGLSGAGLSIAPRAVPPSN